MQGVVVRLQLGVRVRWTQRRQRQRVVADCAHVDPVVAGNEVHVREAGAAVTRCDLTCCELRSVAVLPDDVVDLLTGRVQLVELWRAAHGHPERVGIEARAAAVHRHARSPRRCVDGRVVGLDLELIGGRACRIDTQQVQVVRAGIAANFDRVIADRQQQVTQQIQAVLGTAHELCPGGVEQADLALRPASPDQLDVQQQSREAIVDVEREIVDVSRVREASGRDQLARVEGDRGLRVVVRLRVASLERLG